ncbi:MAG: hypothetical protein KIT72_17985 [Polyangiaceae bacterium]|nr:hypothetical protein [Polyangiaceae bacterium]MCW5792306.1 hypothetical protein [Polyangiaceae bacterium]
MDVTDENAYGFFFSYFEIEDDEYDLEPDDFARRFTGFRELIEQVLAEEPPGEGCEPLWLGHAVYLEVAEGDEQVDPFAWTKRTRARLEESGYRTVAVLSQGSRWVPSEGAEPQHSAPRLPSEALRRALYADTATRPGEDEAQAPGWGPGLYVDVEAIDSMGKNLKNTPTPLSVAGATFYRFGS